MLPCICILYDVPDLTFFFVCYLRGVTFDAKCCAAEHLTGGSDTVIQVLLF